MTNCFHLCFLPSKTKNQTNNYNIKNCVGAPQVLRTNPSSHLISVRKGEKATLTLTVCADPRPRHVAWEWGSLRLEAGAQYGTFKTQYKINLEKCIFR